MSSPAGGQSAAERVIEALTLAVFSSAFAALAAGLLVWFFNHRSDAAAMLLVCGLLGLLVLPLLRLTSALVVSVRERDWLTFGSTLAVLAILLALTFRDAAGFGLE